MTTPSTDKALAERIERELEPWLKWSRDHKVDDYTLERQDAKISVGLLRDILAALRTNPSTAEQGGWQPTLKATLDFIVKVHEGQKDKGGRDYWMHPVSVMNRLGKDATETERRVALLHDVLEDTKTTPDDLLALGYSSEVVDAVKLLSRPTERWLPYMQYIEKVAKSGNAVAIKIKIADLQENMDPERVATMPPDERGIIGRYERALPVLLSAAPVRAEERGGLSEDERIFLTLIRGYGFTGLSDIAKLLAIIDRLIASPAGQEK